MFCILKTVKIFPRICLYGRGKVTYIFIFLLRQLQNFQQFYPAQLHDVGRLLSGSKLVVISRNDRANTAARRFRWMSVVHSQTSTKCSWEPWNRVMVMDLQQQRQPYGLKNNALLCQSHSTCDSCVRVCERKLHMWSSPEWWRRTREDLGLARWLRSPTLRYDETMRKVARRPTSPVGVVSDGIVCPSGRMSLCF